MRGPLDRIVLDGRQFVGLLLVCLSIVAFALWRYSAEPQVGGTMFGIAPETRAFDLHELLSPALALMVFLAVANLWLTLKPRAGSV